MKKITTLLTVAWLICQLPTAKLKALKEGDAIKVKDCTVEVWALKDKNVLILKHKKDE